MPNFTFTSPDGKTYDVSGPEGATKEQAFGILQQRLGSSKTAADTPPAAAQPPQKMGAFVGGNLSKGVADVVGMPVDLANSAIEGTKGLANAILGTHLKANDAPTGGSQWFKDKFKQLGSIGPSAEPRNDAQKIAAAALEGAPTAVLPGGGARALPRIAAAAGAGAGGEAGRQIGGTGGQVAGSLLGGMAGGMMGAERGIAAPPSEAARASQASGIPLTLGQETGSKTLTFTENALRDLFPSASIAHKDELAQVTAGANRITQMADRLSAPQGVPAEALETNIGEKLRYAYQNTTKKIANLRDTQAQQDYGAVRQLAGDTPVIGYSNTLDTLGKIIAENENVPAADARKIAAQARSIRDALTETKAGAPATPPSLLLGANGQPMSAGLPAAPSTTGAVTHTINDAMKTRSAWGQAARRSGNIFSDVDPNANQLLAKRLFGAINRDFDAASTAQTPIAQALKAANQNYAKASQSLTFIEKSALGKLLGEDVADAAFTGVQASTKAPEAIAKKYLTMTPSQAKSVTAILQLHQPEVLQDVKAFVLRNGLEQSRPANGMPVSFAKFRSQMDKVAPKLSQLGFSDKEIKDIKDVTDTMARAGDKAGTNNSKTAGVAHLAALPALAMSHPLAAVSAAVTPYVASRALLTAPGRDLLRAAYKSTNGKAQAAALGALRAQYVHPRSGDPSQGQTPPPVGGPGIQIPPQ